MDIFLYLEPADTVNKWVMGHYKLEIFTSSLAFIAYIHQCSHGATNCLLGHFLLQGYNESASKI